jgi:hypothetical protein
VGLLVFVYFVLSVIVSGKVIYDGATWAGVALLIGSIIGFVAGSGARGGSYLGQRKSALIIGIVLLVIGMALPFYFDVTFSLFGFQFAGDTWVGIGAAVGWFAAKPEDAGAGDTATP